MNPFNNNSNINNNFDSQVNQLMNSPMFQMLRNKGMSPEQMVRYMCQQRGINVEQFMNQLKNTNR